MSPNSIDVCLVCIYKQVHYETEQYSETERTGNSFLIVYFPSCASQPIKPTLPNFYGLAHLFILFMFLYIYINKYIIKLNSIVRENIIFLFL